MLALQRRIAGLLLLDYSQLMTLNSMPSVLLQAVAYEYNTEFGPVLQERMNFYSTDPSADTLSRVQVGVGRQRGLMHCTDGAGRTSDAHTALRACCCASTLISVRPGACGSAAIASLRSLSCSSWSNTRRA